jgi:hypothetical protein
METSGAMVVSSRPGRMSRFPLRLIFQKRSVSGGHEELRALVGQDGPGRLLIAPHSAIMSRGAIMEFIGVLRSH